MNSAASKTIDVTDAVSERIAELFKEQQQNIIRHTDRLFSWLMICQWFFAIGLALWISPRTWSGVDSQIHPHVWLAIFLGGIITSAPVFLARKQPGKTLTRHVVAIGQMLMSALLIHLTGGRIETHFHVFCSLAILAFYRDWRVLISASAVVCVDHIIRGIFWPESVYGVLYASIWRSFEHAGWLAFEVTFLIIAIRKSLSEMLLVAERQARLESLKEGIERTVAERTSELTKEIAEREKVEESLHESQALYHSLVEQLPAGVFRKDGAGRYVLVNSWFCHLRGKSPDDVLKKNPVELALLGQERDEEIRLLNQGIIHHEQIMRTGQPIEVDEQYPGADGKIRHLHVIKSPVFGPDGKVIGSQGILMDITQRKHAEAELQYERNLLSMLMDRADDRIYFKDLKSRFIRSSTSLARLFGITNANELVGKRDSDFFGDEHAREALDDEQTIIRTGEPIINKVEKETWQDGHVTWALSSKMPLRDVQGEIIGTFGISKDITTIKDAEEKLNEVHKQLVDASRQAGMAEVATSVLHNVGNVLNSVNVSSSLIADKMRNSKIANIAKVVTLIRAHNNDLGNFFTNDPKGKQVPDYLANLASHLAREQEDILHEVGALVNNIIHIKEIVAMQQSYAKSSGVLETLKVADLVEDAIRMNDGAMSRHNVKVARNFADVPPLLTEKHKVLQILVNLIRNAKYACDDSGREDKQITLRVANGEGRVKISVIDNGIGIPAENLTRIFNHGFTTRKDGHGFGLHSGANAAKEMGGSLAVFSDGLGRGATFTLELPVQKQKTDL
jgi:PAS domain S-box-containing protein